MSIFHFLLWLTCAAVYLSLSRSMAPVSPINARQGFVFVALAAYVGLAWAMLVLTANRLLHSPKVARDPIEPGQSLAAIIGLIALVDIAGPPVMAWLGHNSTNELPALRIATPAILFALPMLARPKPHDWRGLFLILASLESVRLLLLVLDRILGGAVRFPIVNQLPLLRAIVALAWIGYEISRDSQQHVKRTAWHTLGLIAAIVWLSLPVVIKVE